MSSLQTVVLQADNRLSILQFSARAQGLSGRSVGSTVKPSPTRSSGWHVDSSQAVRSGLHNSGPEYRRRSNMTYAGIALFGVLGALLGYCVNRNSKW